MQLLLEPSAVAQALTSLIFYVKKAVQRAIELSEQKYCSVGAMLRYTAGINTILKNIRKL